MKNDHLYLKFCSFIKENKLFDNNSKILIAVSGGIDSVCLLHLFTRINNIQIGIAHCNFTLRGAESEEDEIFVKNLAQQLKIPIFIKRFDTIQFAKENKISIQEAARTLRYKWFEEIRSSEKFDYIATAHNADDAIETWLINLFRGSGLKGLCGIPMKNKNIIRPLIFAYRDDIVKYALYNNITFREDSSNKENYYLRNNIRHNLIPILDKINPSFKKNILEASKNINDSLMLLNEFIDKFIMSEIISNNNITEINIKKLDQLENYEYLLYFILNNYGFNRTTIRKIATNLKDYQTGKKFKSPSHEILFNRGSLQIYETQNNNKEEIEIDINSEGEFYFPFNFNIEIKDIEGIGYDTIIKNKNENIAYLDAKKISFPLKLRKWKKGDRFIPLGMKKHKKISDFLIDLKIPLNKKNEIYVFETKNEICWVVSYRISEKYKVSNKSKEIMIIKIGN